MAHLKRGLDGRMQVVGSYDKKPIPHNQQTQIRGYSERMKRKPTEGERAYLEIASRIFQFSDKRINFRRQREFFITKGVSFIADFYFPDFHLVVELDGGVHHGEVAQAKDAWRTELLGEHERVSVRRFPNERAINDPLNVMRETLAVMRTMKHEENGLVRRCRSIEGMLIGCTATMPRDESGYHLRIVRPDGKPFHLKPKGHRTKERNAFEKTVPSCYW